MSKIICDICGTSYPDTANACPICGYPRTDSEKAAEEQVAVAQSVATASRGKGGHFSNKNVKKRNHGEATPSRRESHQSRKPEPEDTEPDNNRGLVIAVVVLAIAVILVGAYIGIRFFLGRNAYDNPNAPAIGTNPSTVETQTSATTLPVETGVPCVALTVSDSSVEFLGPDRGWKLTVTPTPADTTQGITFASSDESVVTVTADGRLTSVGPGNAVITITCGEITKMCQVVCDFGEETTAPEETTKPEETTAPVETTEPEQKGFQLDRNDVTLFSVGESFTFGITYDGSYLSPTQVTWESKDPEVATVDNGKVTAVAGGTTTITATYNNVTESCIIRCRIEDTSATEETTKPSDSNWKISSSDVTLVVGEQFTLKITNDAGQTASASWSASASGIVEISGNSITAKAVGTVNVSATVDGQTYTCIVRVIQSR